MEFGAVTEMLNHVELFLSHVYKGSFSLTTISCISLKMVYKWHLTNTHQFSLRHSLRSKSSRVTGVVHARHFVHKWRIAVLTRQTHSTMNKATAKLNIYGSSGRRKKEHQ